MTKARVPPLQGGHMKVKQLVIEPRTSENFSIRKSVKMKFLNLSFLSGEGNIGEAPVPIQSSGAVLAENVCGLAPGRCRLSSARK